MAGLKADRKKIFDLEEKFRELGIELGSVKPEETAAMLPLKFSYDGRTLKVERYAAVRDESEYEKAMELLRGSIKNEKLTAEIGKAGKAAGKLIIEAQLDSVEVRPFVYRKSTPYEAAKKIMSGFFGKSTGMKEKLYLDSSEDIKRIDWLDVFKDSFRKNREYRIGTEKGKKTEEEVLKEAAETKAVESRRVLVNEKIREAKEGTKKTREIVVLRFGGSPANTIEGDSKTMSAAEEKLKDKGLPSQLIQKETRTVIDTRKVTNVPVVNIPSKSPYEGRGGR